MCLDASRENCGDCLLCVETDYDPGMDIMHTYVIGLEKTNLFYAKYTSSY